MGLVSNLNFDFSKIEDIFFKRPVSHLAKPKIGLLLGRHASLTDCNAAFEVLMAMGYSPLIVADSSHKLTGIPAEIFLVSTNKMHYSNSDEAISALEGCSMIIALCGREINSALELLLSKLAVEYRGFLVADSTTLDKHSWKAQPVMYFSAIKSILSQLKKRIEQSSGLNLKADYIREFSSQTGSIIMSVDESQALVADSSISADVMVINAGHKINKTAFAVLVATLLAESFGSYKLGFINYVMAGAYLYTESYEKEDRASGLKKFLEKQF